MPDRDVDDEARTLAWLARMVESNPRAKSRVLRTWLGSIEEIAGAWRADIDAEMMPRVAVTDDDGSPD